MKSWNFSGRFFVIVSLEGQIINCSRRGFKNFVHVMKVLETTDIDTENQNARSLIFKLSRHRINHSQNSFSLARDFCLPVRPNAPDFL